MQSLLLEAVRTYCSLTVGKTSLVEVLHKHGCLQLSHQQAEWHVGHAQAEEHKGEVLQLQAAVKQLQQDKQHLRRALVEAEVKLQRTAASCPRAGEVRGRSSQDCLLRLDAAHALLVLDQFSVKIHAAVKSRSAVAHTSAPPPDSSIRPVVAADMLRTDMGPLQRLPLKKLQ